MKYEVSLITLILLVPHFNPVQVGGDKMSPTCVTFTNVGISPRNLLTFSFYLEPVPNY